MQKTAEPIEIQFGMQSEVGPVNMYYTRDAPVGTRTFDGVWPIEKHCKAWALVVG